MCNFVYIIYINLICCIYGRNLAVISLTTIEREECKHLIEQAKVKDRETALR